MCCPQALPILLLSTSWLLRYPIQGSDGDLGCMVVVVRCGGAVVDGRGGEVRCVVRGGGGEVA